MARSQIVALVVMGLALCTLFFFAGRALTMAGAKRGLVSPWIAVSLLFIIPFCFLKAFVIPSGGMEDTLLPGDQIMVRTFPRVSPAFAVLHRSRRYRIQPRRSLLLNSGVCSRYCQVKQKYAWRLEAADNRVSISDCKDGPPEGSHPHNLFPKKAEIGLN